MFVWLLLLVSVFWSLRFRYQRRHMRKLASAIPRLKDELPLIGVAHKMVGNTEVIMKQLQKGSYETMQNGGIIRTWMGHRLFFLAVDPVDIEMVLKTCLEKDDINRFLRKITGNGGIFAPDLESYKKQSFLDLLIHLSGGENGYTNVELREEVLTLVMAGTDTSAVAFGYTLQMMAKYPEIQEKVYKEICEVFEDDRMLAKEDLVKLKYLERVVKETMRLFPPVPIIIRKVLEDITLPSGRVLPAGSGVVCSIWGVHRDPKYWGPDAEEFDPDRFLPERFNLKHPCSYMPFSNGPRNCIGYQYALMSVKTALSTILRHYKVVEDREDGPVPKIRVEVDIMMRAVDGYQVALERRDKVPT